MSQTVMHGKKGEDWLMQCGSVEDPESKKSAATGRYHMRGGKLTVAAHCPADVLDVQHVKNARHLLHMPPYAVGSPLVVRLHPSQHRALPTLPSKLACNHHCF